jgi:hypothetical protein
MNALSRRLSAVTVALAVGFSLACGAGTEVPTPPKPTEQPAPATPEAKAAAIADALAADATKVDDVLKQHGLTAEAYEELLFAIASDAARTKAYLDARKSK